MNILEKFMRIDDFKKNMESLDIEKKSMNIFLNDFENYRRTSKEEFEKVVPEFIRDSLCVEIEGMSYEFANWPEADSIHITVDMHAYYNGKYLCIQKSYFDIYGIFNYSKFTFG